MKQLIVNNEINYLIYFTPKNKSVKTYHKVSKTPISKLGKKAMHQPNL